jgi:hypothetical protein
MASSTDSRLRRVDSFASYYTSSRDEGEPVHKAGDAFSDCRSGPPRAAGLRNLQDNIGSDHAERE